MNERIEELKKQAMIRVNNPIVNSDGKVVCDDWEEGISLSKFAELIVRECAEICDQQSRSSWNYDRKVQAKLDRDLIKEHFGVE